MPRRNRLHECDSHIYPKKHEEEHFSSSSLQSELDMRAMQPLILRLVRSGTVQSVGHLHFRYSCDE